MKMPKPVGVSAPQEVLVFYLFDEITSDNSSESIVYFHSCIPNAEDIWNWICRWAGNTAGWRTIAISCNLRLMFLSSFGIGVPLNVLGHLFEMFPDIRHGK